MSFNGGAELYDPKTSRNLARSGGLNEYEAGDMTLGVLSRGLAVSGAALLTMLSNTAVDAVKTGIIGQTVGRNWHGWDGGEWASEPGFRESSISWDVAFEALSFGATGGSAGASAAERAAAEIGQAGQKSIVIGETMARVENAAGHFGAEFYGGMPGYAKGQTPHLVAWLHNKTWLTGKIGEGYKVISIGRDPMRFPLPPPIIHS
jgi:hypothetical protein